MASLPRTDRMTRSTEVRDAIVQYVLNLIDRGERKVGDRLPTEADLAAHFSTSRSNVNKAMKELESRGVISRHRRRGTFVRRVHHAAIHHARQDVQSRVRQIHVVAPLQGAADMHWNSGALSQFETLVNKAGHKVVHESLPDLPAPDQLADLVGRIAQTPSAGIVILNRLVGGKERLNHESALIPFVQAMLPFHGRICFFNRAGASLESWPFDAVSLAPMDEGVSVGRYLVQNGVRRAVCVGNSIQPWSRLRVAGVQAAVNAATDSIDLRTRWVADDTNTPDALYESLLGEIADDSDRPTLVMPNDQYAARLLELAETHDVACPRDFCLISFDNDDRYRRFNITSVAPPAGRVGEVIGQVMCDQISRPAGAAVNLKLKSIIVERSTFTLENETS